MLPAGTRPLCYDWYHSLEAETGLRLRASFLSSVLLEFCLQVRNRSVDLTANILQCFFSGVRELTVLVKDVLDGADDFHRLLTTK